MAVDVSDALPDVSLQPGHTVTVELDDAAAVITGLNVYALNLETGERETFAAIPVLLAHEPEP